MKKLILSLLLLAPLFVNALEQPPFRSQEAESDLNFIEIFRIVDQHRHTGADGSSKLGIWTVNPDNTIHYDAGNVGIGTTSPGQKLDVEGNIRFSTGNVVGNIQSGHINNGSVQWNFGSFVGGDLSGMRILQIWDGSFNDEEVVFLSHDGGVGAGEGLRINKSRDVHIQKIGTADVELEVSDGATQGGGTVHAATFAAHSSRTRKSDIKYLTVADEKKALQDLMTLKPAEYKYRVIKDTTTMVYTRDPKQKLRRGLIYEDTPTNIRDDHESISLNAQILELQMALKEVYRKVETLEGK